MVTTLRGPRSAEPAHLEECVLVGKESAGKSQLAASLTGKRATVGNYRGTTVSCDVYSDGTLSIVDTPGIMFQADSATTRIALQRLQGDDRVLLVAKATHLDEDLAELLPLVRGKRGAVAVTHWDKVAETDQATAAIERMRVALGTPIVPVDARQLSTANQADLRQALDGAQPFPLDAVRTRFGWRIEPRRTILEHRRLGPIVALLLLLAPAAATVWLANWFAGVVDPLAQSLLAGPVAFAERWPAPASDVLTGDYGALTMGPLLFVWAVPTVVLYALLLGAYKASGLMERVTVALHPLLRPFGLSGRDLARVVMGFGCNVPAVISTRACSSCTRGACVSAIAFGSACSYQFGATLAVFSAAGKAWLAAPFLLYLTATTLIYTRLTSPREARSPLNLLVIERQTFLEWPRPAALWREASGTIIHFITKAIPIFLVITVIASLLAWLGVIDRLAAVLNPLMGALNLPAEAALPTVLASVRKDGILLFAENERLGDISGLQLLVGVYLAGVLLPCLVTALTIAREQSRRFAATMLLKQASAAIAFTALLAWGGALLGG